MEKRIIDFIKDQKVASICCVDVENRPYCFSCYYAFDEQRKRLYFKSSAGTHHMQLIREKPFISGTILPDKLDPMALQGIQFSGSILDRVDCSQAKAFYHKRYPFALAMAGDVYTVELHWIKMTDNTFTFGNKRTWQLEAELQQQ